MLTMACVLGMMSSIDCSPSSPSSVQTSLCVHACVCVCVVCVCGVCACGVCVWCVCVWCVCVWCVCVRVVCACGVCVCVVCVCVSDQNYYMYTVQVMVCMH